LLVDGSKNPEKVPDLDAQRHFILQASEHSTPNAQELSRRNAMLHLLGLSPSDQTALVTALAGVREQLDTLNWNDSAPDPAAASARDAKYKQILDSAWQRASTSVSPAGWAKLSAYLQTHVKRGIKIYGISSVRGGAGRCHQAYCAHEVWLVSLG
jgi:hypothetical protein